MDVGDGNLVLTPKFLTNKSTKIYLIAFIYPFKFVYSIHCYLPQFVFRDGTSAFLDEVVVREDEEVYESSGAGPSLSSGGDEILQCRVESDGRDQVLLFNSQPS
jgi:hypothetical protein